MEKRQPKKQRSIIKQTVLRVSGIFIMVLVLLTVLFTMYIGVYMRDNILESQRRQVDTVASAMEARLDRLAEPMILLAEYEHTSRLLTGYYEKYSAEWMNSIRNMDAYLQNINLFTDYIIDINLLDARAKGVYSLRDVLSLDYAYGEQEWFLQALEKDGLVKYAPPHGTGHLYQKNINDTFSMIYPVKRSGQLIGYIVMECDLYRIADFLDREGLDSGYLLLDDAGDMISGHEAAGYTDAGHADIGRADAAPLHVGPLHAAPLHAGSPYTGTADYTDIPGGETRILQDDQKLYVAHRLAANQWIVVLETDKEVLMDPVRHLFMMIGLIVIITAAILAAVNLYHIKIMEKPFHALIRRIQSYDGSGAESIPEYSNAPKELAVIRDQFEHMADKMNGLIQDVYVARLKQRESELEALTNQLNPHFLYNVFQVIQTKAVLDDNREIEEMIQALSMMMRYTMERKRDQVKISDEIEYIRHYLMFYKVRFPQLFDYTIECPEEIMECRTIKFILQPVVENCFKHAFKNRTSGGLVRITAREEDRDIVFEITDNGCGVEEERLTELKRKLKEPSAEGGIGILNTNTRLRLVYGRDYGLDMESRAGEYMKVIVRIKKEGESVV